MGGLQGGVADLLQVAGLIAFRRLASHALPGGQSSVSNRSGRDLHSSSRPLAVSFSFPHHQVLRCSFFSLRRLSLPCVERCATLRKRHDTRAKASLIWISGKFMARREQRFFELKQQVGRGARNRFCLADMGASRDKKGFGQDLQFYESQAPTGQRHHLQDTTPEF